MAINQIGDGSADGIELAPAGSKIGCYGATPVAQRATAAVHAQSLISATSYMSVTSNLAAFAAEVGATLQALGIWA